MASTSPNLISPIPILLIKNKSTPNDAYEEVFAKATTTRGCSYDPIFVPILEHGFNDAGIQQLRDILVRQRANSHLSATGKTYGGLIFTSQRAVEAFARVVENGATSNNNTNEGDKKGKTGEDSSKTSWPYLQDVPIYSIGPATTRALHAIPLNPPLRVLGDHTGNGEDLAYFIRENYASLHQQISSEQSTKIRPLLFLVGERRRDIIPKILMDRHDGDNDLSSPVQVDEVVVYDTGVLGSFADSFYRTLGMTRDRPARWIILFSPIGCETVLAGAGLLKEACKANRRRTTYVATIGPTTRGYLRSKFGVEPDVCADKPSPIGLLLGITEFMEKFEG